MVTAAAVGSLVLRGQKRVGKTSIVRTLESRLAGVPDGPAVAYLEVGPYGGESVGATVAALAPEICRVINGALQPAEALPIPDFREGSLAPLIGYADQALELSSRNRLLLVLDEFDELPYQLFGPDELARSFFNTLRALTNKSALGIFLIGGEKMEFALALHGDVVVDIVPAPQQAVARKVRKPYLPLVAEGIRADLLFLAVLAGAGIRRHRVGRGEDKLWTPAGVPVPPSAEHAYEWADLVELLYSSGCRPGEALGAETGSYPSDVLGTSYWKVAQRLVLYEGVIKPGTKSRKYPEKNVLLLGTVGETLARRASAASEGVATFAFPVRGAGVRREERAVRLLFPYPGTSVPWSSEQYANFRDDYFTPLAAARGLGPESDDPYSTRHVYTSLRIARHDPPEHIERSLGSGMVSDVYADVIHAYEGKGPLDIDAAIREAREQAVAELAQRLKPFRLDVPVVAANGL
jgi:hypothetical protein